MEEIFGGLARSGRMAGPNNLLDPILRFLRSKSQAKRNEITRYLMEAWIAEGGKAMPLVKWEPRVKKTLIKLKAAGLVREMTAGGRRVHGVWECVAGDSPVLTDRELTDGVSSKPVGAEIEVGAGSALVYGVYSAQERDALVAIGEHHWPIKVGKTTAATPFDRMREFAFHRRKPEWGIAIRTERPDELEDLIKRTLAFRGRRDSGDGGTEWFVTNLDEIRKIYEDNVQQ